MAFNKGDRRSDLRIYQILDQILQFLRHIMAELDDLKSAVARERTVNASALAFIKGLAQKLNDMQQQQQSGTDISPQLADLASQLNQDSDALAAAVSQNTAAQGEAQSGAQGNAQSQTSSSSGSQDNSAAGQTASQSTGSSDQSGAASTSDQGDMSNSNSGSSNQ